MASRTHRKINNILTVLTVSLGVYLLLSPLLPAIDFWWQKRGGFDVPAYARSGEDENSKSLPVELIPEENRLAIPTIGLDELVFDGSNKGLIDKGVYRQYQTSTPDKGGNTVLTGHRFSYTPSVKAPFYHLDKVKLGDTISLAWQKKVYRYNVVDIRVVEPTEISVEANTKEPKLTLYTCTPLWTADKRLVIVASLEGVVE